MTVTKEAIAEIVANIQEAFAHTVRCAGKGRHRAFVSTEEMALILAALAERDAGMGRLMSSMTNALVAIGTKDARIAELQAQLVRYKDPVT